MYPSQERGNAPASLEVICALSFALSCSEGSRVKESISHGQPLDWSAVMLLDQTAACGSHCKIPIHMIG